MPETPLYEDLAGALCLDFVNTVDRPGPADWNERLEDYADLARWCLEAGALPVARVRRLLRRARQAPDEAARVLTRARQLRESLFRVFTAVARETRPARADLARLNEEVAASLERARVVRDGKAFRWDWCSQPDALDAPLWPIARSAAELLVSLDRELVKECAADKCLWLFVDRTKNHRRRWCDMKSCGNRAKVRRHRARCAEREA